ncbi:inositol 2-dehydrogenase [Hoeflea sp. YIM 152468]|uniref:inositol 2-dehydrogenase n=1 Tax=Hoeflea sp. YIM 152468 TaxID=3031759 RepID=UPI0023DB3C52|nr:inositol 2-dehydrogenase [Hoeflea sp. YIM 152468]MDF1607395.1 inositol 2-dehydrogenase [Hoeflea sp. YIM 152468]
MVNIGILGCGRIGQVHARSVALVEGARVAAVADAFADAANALAVKTGAKVMTAEQMIASPDIDAVIIGTPTDTHFDLIQASAKAGKAIFCEKPVDMSAARIRDCITTVDTAGVPFLTGFNRRFDAGFAAIRARICDGEIGDVELVTILSRDPSPPPVSYIQSSGGLFRDMMIHDFDMARFLLGEDIVRVYATGSALVDPAIGEAGDVDTAVAVLTTASGKICQISNSRRASYGYDQRVEVHGARGLLRADNMRKDNVEFAGETGFRTAPAQHFFLERYAGAYLAEMAHFVACLQSGQAPSPGIRDGLAAQLIADAAAQSLATGAAVDLL